MDKITSEKSKQCDDCGKVKPPSEFYKKAGNLCRACVCRRATRYRQAYLLNCKWGSCKKCGSALNPGNKTGLCRQCYILSTSTPIVIKKGQKMKNCIACNQLLPLSGFSKSKVPLANGKKKIYYSKKCKKCRSHSSPNSPAFLESMKREGYIYILKCGSFYKIGKSIRDNLEHRLRWLDTSIPYPTKIIGKVYKKGYGIIEKRLHRKFAEYQTKGEWFQLSDKIANQILADIKNGKYG